jgi:hypothetical protein
MISELPAALACRSPSSRRRSAIEAGRWVGSIVALDG